MPSHESPEPSSRSTHGARPGREAAPPAPARPARGGPLLTPYPAASGVPPPGAPPASGPPAKTLRDLADEYARLLSAHDPRAAAATGMPGHAILPDFSPEALASRLASERSLRERVEAVTEGLDPSDRLLRDQLLDRLASSIDLIDSGEEGGSLGSLASPFQRIREELTSPRLSPEPGGAEEADLAEAEAKWEDAWNLHRIRLEALPSTLEGLSASLDASAAQGVIAPLSQVDVVVGQARDLTERTWWHPPEDLPATLRVGIQDAEALARRAITDFADHLRANLGPRAPRAEGVGPQRHALWMRRLLGTQVDPEETYAWAEQELEEVIAQQDAVAADVLGPGAVAADLDAHLRSDPSQGLSPQDYIAWAQQTADQAWDAVVGTILDPPDVLGRPVVRLGEPGGGVHYEEPGEVGGRHRPGTMLRSPAQGDEVMWPWAERTTVLHETVPGHHAHSGWHAADSRLSPWQRHLGRVPGCNEGWALYGESLGREMGLLSAPADHFGWLAARRWRLARTLVDLGVHSHLSVPAHVAALPGASGAWDRATVTALLRHHTVISEGFLRFEVARQLGWPAQALSYVLGERVWLAGRRAAEARALSEGRPWGRAELRDFHNRSIALGSLGLDLLERSL
ncbi:MAG: DUF885 domain-containing protein [Actinomyces bowdenii]|nr:DUF885 domain-containing protein [Actinomyces bowdenii]